MNLGEFIDTYKEAIAQRVVESYPPLYRPSENGGTLPRLLRTPWGRRGTPSGARPSPSKPTGERRWWARWARAKRLSARRRRTWRASEASWCSARPTWCPSGSGRWSRRCPAHAPPSSSPSPTWRGCASPSAPARCSR